MNHPKVILPFADVEEQQRAAVFVAELVKQNVIFTATYDIVTHVGGNSGTPGMVIALTGY